MNAFRPAALRRHAALAAMVAALTATAGIGHAFAAPQQAQRTASHGVNATFIMLDGTTTAVQADSVRYCSSVGDEVLLLNGQHVPLDSVRSIDVLESDDNATRDGTASVEITLVNGSVVDGDISSACDLSGQNDLGRFSVFPQDMQRLQFDSGSAGDIGPQSSAPAPNTAIVPNTPVDPNASHSSDAPKGHPKGDWKHYPKHDWKHHPWGDSKDHPKGDPKDHPKGDPKDQPKGDPKDQPKGDPKDQPKGDPKDQPKGDPKDQPKGDPKDQPKGDQKAPRNGGPKWEPKRDSNAPGPAPQRAPVPAPKPAPAPEPAPAPQAHVEQQAPGT